MRRDDALGCPALVVALAVASIVAVCPAAAQAQSQFKGTPAVRQDERSEPQPHGTTQRQAEPQRQSEPRRQPEPQRQAEPARQSVAAHWGNPGPAWRPLGPAWRDLSLAQGAVQRPGEDAFRPALNPVVPRGNGPRRDDGPRHGGHRGDSTPVVGYPAYVPFGYTSYYSSSFVEASPVPGLVAPRVDEPRLGFLRLRVRPRTADVFVDGAFAGVVDDFGGSSERMLPAGTHRIEISAPGFEPLTFDVRVPENDTLTFTRELDPIERRAPPAAAAPAAEVPHKTMYIVPRCYVGDRPPAADDLPSGCSLADLRVLP